MKPDREVMITTERGQLIKCPAINTSIGTLVITPANAVQDWKLYSKDPAMIRFAAPWTITHVPTGWRCGGEVSFTNRQAASAYAEVLGRVLPAILETKLDLQVCIAQFQALPKELQVWMKSKA